MKDSHKVLPFPTPPEEPAPTTIVVQIGTDRFAIHGEIEELAASGSAHLFAVDARS